MAIQKRVKRWVHTHLQSSYPFRPKKGNERYRYRCPFCGFMVHSERFLTLNLPVIESDIIAYGGYRGIRVYKPELSSDMRIRVLEAMKQKIEWLYEKIGGEILWLKSKCVSIQDVPNISYLRTDVQSIPQRKSVLPKSGIMRSVQNSQILFAKREKL